MLPNHMTDKTQVPGALKVILSFALAMILRILPLKPALSLFNPDWLALLILFWSLSLPPRIGVLRAWTIGLIADALTGRLMGQHALAYAVMAYLSLRGKASITILRKPVQALWILGLLIIEQLLILWTEHQVLPTDMELAYWYPSLTGALVWPGLTWTVERNNSRSLS